MRASRPVRPAPLTAALSSLLLTAASAVALAVPVSAAPVATCPPTLGAHTCTGLAPVLPLDVDFDVPGDLDAFTVRQPSTTGRHLPANLVVDGAGTLRVRTTTGSNYLTPTTTTPAGNSLDNGLGVGLDGSRPTTVTVELVDLPATANAGEGFGVWFGPREDDHVKLTAVAAPGGTLKPQLLREVGGVSGPADAKGWRTLPLTGGRLTLTLRTDPVAGTVSGSYQVPGSEPVALGSLTVPASFFEAPGQRALTPGASTFTGLIASHRRARSALTVGVDRFTVTAAGAPASTPVPTAPTAPTGALTLAPDDRLPGDRVVMNRIQTRQDSAQRTRSTATVTLRNPGAGPATVTSLKTTGPFTVSGPPLPLVLAPGATATATVTYTATSGPRSSGTLTATGSAGLSASLPLEGWWQRYSERGLEPLLKDITAVAGYTTALPSAVYSRGAYKAFSSDEVLSPYWRAQDTGRPVRVTQLAAFHTYPSYGYLRWFPQGSPGALSTAIAHASTDAQSLLPRTSRPALGDRTGLSTSTFTPGGAFGLKVQDEWSDPGLNPDALDRQKGCTATVCGHHVRTFVLRDAAGAVVPGSYLVAVDLSSINYDFQDLVFVVENVRPAR